MTRTTNCQCNVLVSGNPAFIASSIRYRDITLIYYVFGEIKQRFILHNLGHYVHYIVLTVVVV